MSVCACVYVYTVTLCAIVKSLHPNYTEKKLFGLGAMSIT